LVLWRFLASLTPILRSLTRMNDIGLWWWWLFCGTDQRVGRCECRCKDAR
jgi:hypothetical protein